jgi:hypothetical protein
MKKKTFTINLNAQTQAKTSRAASFARAVLMVLLCGISYNSSATVSLSPATGGTNICANKAATGSAPAWTTLSSITILEGITDDIQGGSGSAITDVLVLNAPTGWQFNPASPISLSFSSGGNILSMAYTITATTLTVSLDVDGNFAPDVFSISGLQVQATSTSAASGNIYASSVTGITGIVAGTSGTNFGNLSQDPIVTPSVTISAAPTGVICAGTNVTFTPAPLNGGATPTYQWAVNGFAVSSDLAYSTATLTNGDLVEVTMTATGCLTTTTATSNTIVMTVNPAPASHNVTGGGDFCAGGGGVSVGVDATETGINYQLYRGATAIGSPIAGTGSAISFGSQTVAGTYTVLATNASTLCTRAMAGNAPVVVNPLPTVRNVTGGGSYCAGGSGTPVGLDISDLGINYQLYNGTSTVGGLLPGNGSALSFGSQTATGTYTVLATDATTSCPNDMSGFATISINANPIAFNVTGGGSYCSGGTGVTVGLDSSTTGISYQLYNGTTAVGSPISGTGFPFSFGLQTAAGTYTVQATNISTACTSAMASNATISINPLPNVYNVVGGGSYCAGGTGVTVGLDNSDVGIFYILYNGSTTVGSPVAGTGLPLTFGTYTAAGTYTVVGINGTTSCVSDMNDSAVITINPLPLVFNVTGGGGYCLGGTGVNVGLDSSIVGIDYHLYRGSTAVGSAFAGTGAPFSFGLQTVAGTYTVMATNATTTCTKDMSGTATVSINALPDVFNVTGGGSYCAGGAGMAVGLDSSIAGINYQLYNGTTTVGTPFAGTGAPFSFGLQTAAGAYTVLATNATTSCQENMTGSVNVIVTPTVTPTVMITSTAADTICAGTPVAFTAVATDGGALPGYEWKVNGASMSLADTLTYTPVDGDIVSVKLISTAICPSPDTAIDVDTMVITPMVTPYITVAISPNDTVCDSTFITVSGTPFFAGTTPTLTWVVNGSIVGSGPSYTYMPANGDIVYSTMSSDYRCRLVTTVNSSATTVKVDSPIIPLVMLSVAPSAWVGTGTTVTVNATVVNGGATPTYQWYVNNTPQAGATNATFVSSTIANNDSVTVWVTRHDGCSFPNFNSVIFRVGVGTGNISFANSTVTVAPNPSRGTFVVQGALATDADQPISMEISNMLGQVIYQSNFTATHGIINERIQLKDIASGMYLLSMRTANEKKVVHIVVE